MTPATYRRYLRSEHWRNLRSRYRRSGLPQCCAVCGDPRSELHHRTYSRLGREHFADLVPLCDAHHRGVHRLVQSLKKRGKRVSLGKVTRDYVDGQRRAPHNRRAREFWREAEDAAQRHRSAAKRVRVVQRARETGWPVKGGLTVRTLSAVELAEKRRGLNRYEEDAA